MKKPSFLLRLKQIRHSFVSPVVNPKVASGYSHFSYVDSLSEYGSPFPLPGSGAWILQRAIPYSFYSDGMGCYPLFSCPDWSKLESDLQGIGNDLVSLALVTDPFGDYDETFLSRCFPDVLIPFKQHFIVDLSRPIDSFANSHHRRNARKALAQVQVEECVNSMDFVDDWIELYQTLVTRHNIKGIAAFSKSSFAKQLTVPGLVAFRAVKDDVTVGMLLWYVQENRAYYHLGAYSSTGYSLGASFALFYHAAKHFADRGLEWLDLGAGAGSTTGAETGLSRFKQGWSTGTRTAYFCGRIFDHERYEEIMQSQNVSPTKYFPAYRAGEFS